MKLIGIRKKLPIVLLSEAKNPCESVAYTVFWLVYTLLFVVLYIRHRRQESYT